MKNFMLLIFLIYLNKSKDILYSHTNEDNNLYFVFTTFRHGARTAFNRIDYFGNYIPHTGTLTVYGGIQHLKIGLNYRKRYSNFLNMSFNPKEIYIRTSNAKRVIDSVYKELEGLFNKSIERKYFHIINGGASIHDLYNLNNEKHKEIHKYLASCKKKKRILFEYKETFYSEIAPILKDCYGISNPSYHGFCDSTIAAYYEYMYGNDKNNKIAKCGSENATKFYKLCFNEYNTYKGWNEYSSYIFYIFYQNLFEYMNNSVNGVNPLKMILIGGHGLNLVPFMNFLDELKIINRSHYPSYAYNIVIELRKYSNDFYLEFYYNDILKYNNTLYIFRTILDNSKYSNLYNYCGLPPYKISSNEKYVNKEIFNQFNKNESIIKETNDNQTNIKKNKQNSIQQKDIESNEKPHNKTFINESKNNLTKEVEIKKGQTTINNIQLGGIQNNENKFKESMLNEVNNESFSPNNFQRKEKIKNETILKDIAINKALLAIKIKYLRQNIYLVFYFLLISIFVIIVIKIGFIIFYFFFKNKRKEFINLFKIKTKKMNDYNINEINNISNIDEASGTKEDNNENKLFKNEK